MRIATWNLARCRPRSVRAARLHEWMASVDADIWVLTETHRELAPGPGYRIIASSIDAPDRKAALGECWVAIWSRLLAESVDLTADRERAAAVRIKKCGTIVIGTVLPWLNDKRHPEVRGKTAFRARLNEQAADWIRLRDTARRMCIAGDFNQDLLVSGHYYGSQKGRLALRETIARCGLDCLTGGGDDPLAQHPGLACIDHIAIAGLRSAGQPRSNVWPPPGELRLSLSDHYGVWVDVHAFD